MATPSSQKLIEISRGVVSFANKPPLTWVSAAVTCGGAIGEEVSIVPIALRRQNSPRYAAIQLKLADAAASARSENSANIARQYSANFRFTCLRTLLVSNDARTKCENGWQVGGGVGVRWIWRH